MKKYRKKDVRRGLTRRTPFFRALSPLPYFREGEIKRGWVSNYGGKRMLIKLVSMMMLFLGAVTLSGCANLTDTYVTGTATYLQRIALPPNAVMTVRIEDGSKADAPAEVIGEQVIETKGAQVPIPFAVSYDPGKI
jgi:hypothetical protein